MRVRVEREASVTPLNALKVAPAATYEIPSMDEIRSVPDNGLTVVSTFTGCGGSCLGFRWAGFRSLWANEFMSMTNAPSQLLPGVPIELVEPARRRPMALTHSVPPWKGSGGPVEVL